MWKDYKNTESIRTRPALEGLLGNSAFGQNVHSLSFYKGRLMVHVNKYIAYFNVEDKYNISMEVICEYANDEPSQTFVYNGVWYFKQRGCFLQYDGALLKGVEGYVPTTSIARKPSGGGTIHQDVNMLTTRRRNTFLADGESTVFHLDAKNISNSNVIVKVNDKVVTNYTVNNSEGTITFDKAPEKPLTDGQDNVSVEFNAGSDQSHKIKGCTMLQVFDNRVFFSGNSKYPNMIWHSSLDDPTYISDLDYYQEGRDEAPVRGIVAGNNALWVFREPSDESTTVFYHVPTIDAEYGKIYPSTHSSISTGCVGKATNFNDDIVFFSERGMEGISGDVTTEQVVAHRSSLVDRKLTAEAKYRSMVLAEWEGYLLVFIGNKVYLADSRGIFTNENHMEYEWFYWDFGWNNGNLIDVTCAVVHDGVLYIGTSSGNVFTLEAENTDYEAVTSYWVTPKDKFKHPHKLKTTNKRGCVAEATGDISVYAKLEDTDFELIGEYKNVTDYFVSRIKRKKFKDIQLKFYSNTRFSLETVTLEAFIGGYIKR
jgi:hypothetical protein